MYRTKDFVKLTENMKLYKYVITLFLKQHTFPAAVVLDLPVVLTIELIRFSNTSLLPTTCLVVKSDLTSG